VLIDDDYIELSPGPAMGAAWWPCFDLGEGCPQSRQTDWLGEPIAAHYPRLWPDEPVFLRWERDRAIAELERERVDDEARRVSRELAVRVRLSSGRTEVRSTIPAFSRLDEARVHWHGRFGIAHADVLEVFKTAERALVVYRNAGPYDGGVQLRAAMTDLARALEPFCDR
jgi:hypothetical protein